MLRWIAPAVMAGLVLGLLPDASPSAQGVAGLDHIPISVTDLDAASARYRALGFALKPGRPHANGIRNQHVKFTDGTELELITAPSATDPLTTKYRRYLEAGDGPAFLALYVPGASNAPPKPEPPLDYLFFGPRNSSPTDRPEHFAHQNTAESLVGVWLAAADIARERNLFASLGAVISKRPVWAPERMTAEVASFAQGEAILLPASHQRVPGRRIVGATISVRDIAAAGALLRARDIDVRTIAGRESLFLPPAVTHGLWLELRPQKK